MKPEPTSGWKDYRSYLVKENNSNGITTYRGVYYLNDVEFRIYINQQKNGKYLLRGRITAVSPVDGFALQVTGTEKLRRLEKESKDDSRGPTLSNKQYRNKKLNVSAEFYCNSVEEEKVQLAISNAASKLYTKNASLILQRQKQVIKSDTVIPAIAAALYAGEYIAIKHRKIQEKTKKAYEQWLISFCGNLPGLPMSKYKKNMIEQAFGESKVGKHKRGLLSEFWDYCITKGICDGTNPVPNVSKRKLSPQAKQAKALVPQELTLSQQDQLFKYLMKNPSGSACGIALQLWGGFSSKVICSLYWNNVVFSDSPDLVRVNYYLDDNAGATHDYTRPLFVQAARILHVQYERLKLEFSLEEIEKLPILCKQRDLKKAMTANELTQYSAMMLRQTGITEDTFAALRMPKASVAGQILHNTYVSNLVHRCGLASDPGTIRFVCGESLSSSITDDHYTSFTSPAAVERIHTALKAIAPQEELICPAVSTQEDGMEVQVIAPEHTRQRVGVVEEIILRPGEEIEIVCLHGVTGSVSVRAVDENGNRKRAVRKQARHIAQI